ncbi:MAG: hypothetical protein KDE26_13970 [Bacteroidetes bacterium]|nr:hypothetical protein [Bacteroidota bacterium]
MMKLFLSILIFSTFCIASGCTYEQPFSESTVKNIQLCEQLYDESSCFNDRLWFHSSATQIVFSARMTNVNEKMIVRVSLYCQSLEMKEIYTRTIRVQSGPTASVVSVFPRPAQGWVEGEYMVKLDYMFEERASVMKEFVIEK